MSTSTTPSPLVNLVQAIHLPSHRFLLTTSAPIGESSSSSNKVTLHLFAHTPSSDGGGNSSDGNGIGYDGDGNRLPMIIVWEGEVDLEKRGVEPDVLADAVKKGYLHVDMPLTNMTELSSAEEVALKILPPESDPSTFRMKSVPLSMSTGIPHLLEATFELLSRPTAVPDKSELRSLRSQLAQKNEEVASLSTKLASAKATVVRATAADNKKKNNVISPVKKAPVNASGLQPNVKRRRVADDEYGFAGSGSDDEQE